MPLHRGGLGQPDRRARQEASVTAAPGPRPACLERNARRSETTASHPPRNGPFSLRSRLPACYRSGYGVLRAPRCPSFSRCHHRPMPTVTSSAVAVHVASLPVAGAALVPDPDLAMSRSLSPIASGANVRPSLRMARDAEPRSGPVGWRCGVRSPDPLVDRAPPLHIVADERRDLATIRRLMDTGSVMITNICRTSANRLLRSTSRPSFHTAQWKVYGLLTAPE